LVIRIDEIETELDELGELGGETRSAFLLDRDLVDLDLNGGHSGHFKLGLFERFEACKK